MGLSRVAIKSSKSVLKMVEADMVGLRKATIQEMAKEIRKAIQGKDGYISEWPPVRTSAAGRKARKRFNKGAGRKASRSDFRVQAKPSRKSGGFIMVTNKGAVGSILELRPVIRGYRNKHHHAAIRTIEQNWRAMSKQATRHAPARVKSNQIRTVKAKKARAAKAAG